jgi:hypothetical protein
MRAQGTRVGQHVLLLIAQDVARAPASQLVHTLQSIVFVLPAAFGCVPARVLWLQLSRS